MSPKVGFISKKQDCKMYALIVFSNCRIKLIFVLLTKEKTF